MGNTTSTDLQQATDEVAAQQEEAPTPEAFGGVKLYQFVRGTTAGKWELASSSARPRFYDFNEDSKSKSSYFLEIEAGEIDARCDEAMQYVSDKAARRVTFAANDALWALKFPEAAMHTAFVEELQDKVFYNTYGIDNDEKGRAKVLGAEFKDIFFQDAAAEAAAPMEEDGAADDEPDERELREKATPAKAGTPIQGLLMGATDNSYLQRGNQFDVMRNVEGGVEDKELTFSLTPLKGSKQDFTPGKVLMANRETRMNLLSPSTPNTLYHADIEYGKVVSEWKFNKDEVEIPQRDIAADNKAAQLEDVNTFLGLDANRLCRWDMRDPTGVVQGAVNWEGGKDYSRGTNFSCMATSGAGYVVVGSSDGKLRLYNSQTLTQAKTSVPGLGKPITAVDVTYDGRWVLATTDDYLLVVKTTYEEDGKEFSGFTSKAGSKLPVPRLLRLRPEDVLVTQGKKFKDGRFTWVTEAGRQERWIVASIGKYVVAWNFRRVKTAVGGAVGFGGLPAMMDYHLTAKDEDVVAASFMHDRFTPVTGGRARDAMVVATPHKVFSLAS